MAEIYERNITLIRSDISRFSRGTVGNEAAVGLLAVYSEGMAEAGRRNSIVGCVGVLCFAVYWTARFAPEIADTFALSPFGKFGAIGALLAGVLLTTMAAIRDSKWWFVVVVASGITLLDPYIHMSRFPRY